MKKTITEDVVSFSTLNFNETVVTPNFLIKKTPSSIDYKISSGVDVFNYNYFQSSLGGKQTSEGEANGIFIRLGSPEDQEIIEITSELIEQHPELNNAITYGNKLLRSRTQKVSVQQRVIVQFDFDDIFDFSEELWQRACLKLGHRVDTYSFSYPDGADRSQTGTVPWYKNSSKAEAKINGPFYPSESSYPTTFEEWDELFSTGVLNFDTVLESEKDTNFGLSPGRRNVNNLELSPEINVEKLANDKSIFFMINPHDTGILDAQGIDTSEPVQQNFYTTGRWNRFPKNIHSFVSPYFDQPTSVPSVAVFEFDRPRGLKYDLYNETDGENSFSRRLRLSSIMSEYIPAEFWQDNWQRVDDMYTFVSKDQYINYSTNIAKAFFSSAEFRDTSNREEQQYFPNLKLFIPADGNKKSQREEVFLDLSFVRKRYLRKKIISRYTAKSDDFCSTDLTFEPNPIIGELRDLQLLSSPTFSETKTFIEHVFTNIRGEKESKAYYFNGPYDVPYDVYDFDTLDFQFGNYSQTFNIIDNLDGAKEYSGFDNNYLNIDNILVHECLIETLDFVNFLDFAEYFTVRNFFGGFEEDSIYSLHRNISDSYHTSRLDVARKQSGAPDVIEFGPLVFRKQVKPHNIKISFKNDLGIFSCPFEGYTIEEIALGCNNGECLASISTPQWEITSQALSSDLSLLPIDGISRADCINTFNTKYQSEYYAEVENKKEDSSSGALFEGDTGEVFFLLNNAKLERTEGDRVDTSYLKPGGDVRGYWTYGDTASWSNKCGPPGPFGGQTYQRHSYLASSNRARFPYDPPFEDFTKGKQDTLAAVGTYSRTKLFSGSKSLTKNIAWSKSIEIMLDSTLLVNALEANDINDTQTRQNHASLNRLGFWSFNGHYPYGANVFGNSPNMFAFQRMTDVLLSRYSISGIEVENVIGHGIRFRIKNPKITGFNLQKVNFLTENYAYMTHDGWDAVGQQEMAEYTRQLEAHEISYISSVFDSDYWYYINEEIFFPDPDGEEKQGDVAGYSVTNPYFKISGGRIHGPFKGERTRGGSFLPEEEFDPFIPDLIVEVRTTFYMPEEIVSAIPLGYMVGGKFNYFHGGDKKSFVDVGVHQINDSISDIGLIGYAAESFTSTYITPAGGGIFGQNRLNVANAKTEVFCSPDRCPRQERVYEWAWSQEPVVVSETHQIDIPAGCECTDDICWEGPFNDTTYYVFTDGKALECDPSPCKTRDGISVAIKSYGIEPQGQTVLDSYTSADGMEGVAKSTAYTTLYTFGAYQPIVLVHRKRVSADAFSACGALPTLDFDHEDMADAVWGESYSEDIDGSFVKKTREDNNEEFIANFANGGYYNVEEVFPHYNTDFIASNLFSEVPPDDSYYDKPIDNRALPDTPFPYPPCGSPPSFPASTPAYDEGNGIVSAVNMTGVDNSYWANNCLNLEGLVNSRLLQYARSYGGRALEPEDKTLALFPNEYDSSCCNGDEEWIRQSNADGYIFVSGGSFLQRLATKDDAQNIVDSYASRSLTCLKDNLADYTIDGRSFAAQATARITGKWRNFYNDYSFTIAQKGSQ